MRIRSKLLQLTSFILLFNQHILFLFSFSLLLAFALVLHSLWYFEAFPLSYTNQIKTLKKDNTSFLFLRSFSLSSLRFASFAFKSLTYLDLTIIIYGIIYLIFITTLFIINLIFENPELRFIHELPLNNSFLNLFILSNLSHLLKITFIF